VTSQKQISEANAEEETQAEPELRATVNVEDCSRSNYVPGNFVRVTGDDNN
jgi:hypothetical protein